MQVFENVILKWRLLLSIVSTITLSLNISFASPADTLKLNLKTAENLFLEHNLLLLSEKLNINKERALVLQAKSWPNPNLSIDNIQTYINKGADEFPGIGGSGFMHQRNFEIQLEQLIQLAGKRKKGIQLQNKNAELAEATFEEVLLSLKIAFRNNIYEMLYLQNISQDLSFQLNIIADLVKAQKAQFEEGNISQAQFYRIQSLHLSIISEYHKVLEEINEQQKEIKNLLAINHYDYILFNDEFKEDSTLLRISNINYYDLLDISMKNNPSLKVAEKQKDIAGAYLRLEKANAVPDLNLLVNYDRFGSTQLDFIGAGVSMDLPFFNRNKGNIKSAYFNLESTETINKQKQVETENEIMRKWKDLKNRIEVYESIEKGFVNNINEMINSVSNNFKQRDIGLLEFLDFFESFKSSKQMYFETLKSISVNLEELNFLSGVDL